MKQLHKTDTYIFKTKQIHLNGLPLSSYSGMPDCWLQGSMQPEGPTIGQVRGYT